METCFGIAIVLLVLACIIGAIAEWNAQQRAAQDEIARGVVESLFEDAWDCPNCGKPNIAVAERCWFCNHPN